VNPAPPPDALLKPVEALLNRSITAASSARDALAKLQGRCLGMRLSGSGIAVFLAATPRGLELSFTPPAEPEAAITGTPLGFAQLALGDAQEGFASGAVSAEGDAAVAEDFKRLIVAARPDWEEELARLTGDVIAHQTGNFVRGLIAWGRQTRDTLARNAGEFLTEESRDLPNHREVRQFCAAVDETRDRTARLEARLQRLETSEPSER
jgi:ubiquinone biosynthesis protein UbiJ